MKNLRVDSIIISLPFNENVELIDLSIVAINFNRRNHYISSLFYQKISIHGSYIYAGDFNNNRRVLVRKLYNQILSQLTLGSLRESKISYNLSRFFQFIRWCDSNNIHDCLDDDIKCIDAVNKYADYCWENISTGKYKTSTITNNLGIIVDLLREITSNELHLNLPKVKRRVNDRELTLVPDDKLVSENLQILNSIINGAYDFIFPQKQYPYAWEVPEFLNITDNKILVFPIRSWCQIDLNEDGTSKKERVNMGFNYKDGRVITKKELYDKGITDHSTQMRIIRKAKRHLKKHNDFGKEYHTYQKNEFLHCAVSSFIFLLIANTGMNPSQLLSLPWTNEYDIHRDNIDFHSIKYRAFNRKVHFRITSKFLPVFKKYLELREHYLLGKHSNYLIPSFGEKYEFHKDLSEISKRIKSLMKNLGYTKGLVTARQWRCLKAEWLINNADPSVAAKILQNTETTILNHYSSGTFTKHTEELSNFLTKLTSESMITDSPYIISTSVGGCKEPDKPINISSDLGFKSDCRQPEGCLFCANYLIHADENDLRKILSCKYCIENTQVLSRSYDDWHNIYDPVLLRIDEIVNSIAEINLHLVDKMKHDVYTEGNLDSYWSGKLEMLINIGAIHNEKQ